MSLDISQIKSSLSVVTCGISLYLGIWLQLMEKKIYTAAFLWHFTCRGNVSWYKQRYCFPDTFRSSWCVNGTFWDINQQICVEFLLWGQNHISHARDIKPKVRDSYSLGTYGLVWKGGHNAQISYFLLLNPWKMLLICHSSHRLY